MTRHARAWLVCCTLWLAAVAAVGCAGATRVSVAETIGPAPHLAPPQAGGAVPSANRITLLRDTDRDGVGNHHWTKNIIASADGTKLYASVGSNSNVAEHGIDQEEGRAAIWEIDLRSGSHRVFATGLRNPVGMAWEPELGAL